MQTRLVLKPGQDGTKELVQKYGERLVCVRYRYDAEKRKRYKTIELIVDEKDWQPLPRADEVVGVRVAFEEYALRQRVKEAGGRWNQERRLWELRYVQVEALGLEHRVVREEAAMYAEAVGEGGTEAGDEVNGECR